MDTKNFEEMKSYTDIAIDAIQRKEGTVGEVYETLLQGGFDEQEASMRTMAFLLREAQQGRNYWGVAVWGETKWG